MKPITDSLECQRDSPQFRQILEENERNFDNLESKLEKIIKHCTQMVAAGKVFNQEQEHLVHTMWELSNYFAEDATVQGSLNCLFNALREAANFHKILIDQATRAIIKNFSAFIKEEVKGVKEKRHWFERASAEMDSVLQRAATVSRASDGEEMNKQVWATRQAFRHTAIDYMYALSMAQAKKRHEAVDAILSYTKAYSTFYHQGSDLFDDLKPSLDKIAKEVEDMRDEVSGLDKSMENRHCGVSGKVLMAGSDSRNSLFPVSMQGYLFKRTNNAFKSWNRRYFTLQNNQLAYRKRSGEEVTVMEEDLKLCNVKPAVDCERRFCFEITSNTKSHMLQAESEESCKLWIDALSRAISSAIQHQQYPQSPQQSGMYSHDSSSNLSVGSLSLTPSSSPASAGKHSEGGHPATGTLWEEILKIPGNDVCCDCGSPDPKWASINLGITLCIECSGIHRSLGVHYSKVRSLTLDKWDLEVTRVMENLGNEIVNHIYMSSGGTQNQNTSIHLNNFPHPATPNCNRITRESWIKAKYMEKRFVAPISDEESFTKIVNHNNVRHKASGFPVVGSGTPTSTDDSEDTEGGEFRRPNPGVVATLTPNSIPTTSRSDAWKEINAQNILRMESLTPNDLLMTASAFGHLPLMCLSMALGANKNYQNLEGRVPLHQSIMSRSAVAVEYLLLSGVQVNLQDDHGQTPLHLAAIEANILQVYRLIKYRADWRIQDKEGKTAVDHAVQSSEPDLVTLLRVATLSDQLDKEQVEEEMMTIMQDLYRKKNYMLDVREGD